MNFGRKAQSSWGARGCASTNARFFRTRGNQTLVATNLSCGRLAGGKFFAGFFFNLLCPAGKSGYHPGIDFFYSPVGRPAAPAQHHNEFP
jgi:hypothetical protein